MRIGHYMSGLWDHGGVASYIRRVARAQMRAGHRIVLFDEEPAASETIGGTELEPRAVGSSGDVFGAAENLGVDILNLHETVDRVPEEHLPAVRIMHNHAAYCPSGTQHLRARGAPCHRVFGAGCVWGHLAEHCGSLRPGKMLGDFRSIPQQKRVLGQLPVITVSNFLREKMIEAGYDASSIYVVRSPAPDPPPRISPPPREGAPRFAFLGRLAPEKGVAWLLRSVARVDEKVYIDIAGEGWAADRFKALAGELGITDRVTFHGWLNDTQVSDLIQSSRAVLFPSIWHEPAGLVPLESAALGRPVIASRVGGVPEYVTSEFGALVPPGDEEALARHIERLAADWDLARRLGEKGRELARTAYDAASFTRRLHETYRRATSLPAPATAAAS